MSSDAAREQDLSRHAAGYLLAKIIPAIAALGTILVMTRLLSQTEYGIFVLVTTATFTLAQVGGQWLQQAVLRFLPGRLQTPDARTIDAGMAWGLTLTVLVGLACFPVALALSHGPFGFHRLIVALLPVALLLTIAGLVFNCLQTYFTARLSPGRYALHTTLNALLRLALPVLAVRFVTATAQAALFAAAIAYLVWIVPMAIEINLGSALIAGLRDRRGTVAWLQAAMSYGGPMTGWFFCVLVLTSADRFIITAFAGAAATGLYAATYDLVNRGIYLAADAINLASRPLAMRAAESGDDAGVARIIRNSVRFFLLAALPMALGAVLWRYALVRLLLPREYWSGARVIVWIAPGFLAWHVSGYLQQILEARRRPGRVFTAAALAAASNVILNLLLIPRFGYIAAAWTTLLSYVLLLALIAAFARPWTWMLVPWKSLGRVVLGGAAMALILALAPVTSAGRPPLLPLLAFGVAATAAFGAVVVATGEVTLSQIGQLRAAGRMF